MSIIERWLKKLTVSGSSEKVCKTRMIGDRFFECRVKKPNPNYCDHSLCSGDSYICNHEDRALFARK